MIKLAEYFQIINLKTFSGFFQNVKILDSILNFCYDFIEKGLGKASVESGLAVEICLCTCLAYVKKQKQFGNNLEE